MGRCVDAPLVIVLGEEGKEDDVNVEVVVLSTPERNNNSILISE